MGNGVNVGVVWHVLREHVRRDEDVLKATREGKQIARAVLAAPESPDTVLDTMSPSGH
jgi:DNA (cytosine-5)-methyltransferase 1